MNAPDAPDTTTSRHSTLVIGLTGGIGSGKTTVADSFSRYGITVVDADRLAHELVEPGQPALASIISTFGAPYLQADGTLDRPALRAQIYSNPEKKQQLEDILHPLIRSRMQQLLAASTSPYSIAVIPLLLETGQTDEVDRVLVVDVPASMQQKRVAERDGLSENAINEIFASQATREARRAAADDIIVNDRDIASLDARVQELHEHYLELAHANRAS